ncbi:MAG: HEAT repeat domain-containing protein [Melioribacter sp.]|uniref:HEAT repeat domain-containing protein n=1 Tax=Rosettibacter primus TaxID=3111523 RepID=UPI00247DAAE1|nr:HEAT repeat domain-containing protein [Melioribacter sp.]
MNSSSINENFFNELEKYSSDEIIDVLYSLDESSDVEKFVPQICSLISHEDKGVRNAATMLLLNHRPKEAPSHLVHYISSPDISIRNLAGEILAKLGDLSVDALMEYNHDRSDDDNKFIIDLLGIIANPRSVNHIIEVLSTTDNDNVILACIEALGNIRYEDAVDILLLFYERNELYKPTIVEALGKIGSQKALNFLISKFNSEDELTKYSILESLGYIGDVNTYFFLLEQILNVHGPLVWPLITSIFLLKEKYNLDIPFDDKMKSLLMYTLREGNAEHKKIALSLINVFNDKDILLASLRFLGEDYELDEIIRSKVTNNIIFVFEEMPRILNEKPENVVHILNLLLSIISDAMNSEAQSQISLMMIRNLIHSVSEYLTHPDEEVRRASMEIIFNLDPESALLFIDSMINDENIWNKLRLIELLETVENSESTNALIRLAQDEDEMVRSKAQEVIELRKKINSTTK